MLPPSTGSTRFALEKISSADKQRLMLTRSSRLLISAWFGAAVSCSAAIVPFSETFESYGTGDVTVGEFVESSPLLYTIVADAMFGDNNYQALVSSGAGAVNGSAAVAFPGLAGTNFTISTRFRIDSFTTISTSTLNLGFGVLGNDPNFSNGTQYRILFTVSSSNAGEPGTINIQENGTTFVSQARGTSIGVALDTEYTLSVTGTYTGGTIALSATATRLDTNASTTTTVTDATPPSGQYFGYRTAVNAVGGSVSEDIEYDNFTVVPEPASAALAGVALTLVAAGTRRRQR
jgi:hypothetical protein